LSAKTCHLFLYGTLRPDSAVGVPARLVAPLEIVGPAAVAGRIFAKHDPRGTYPVLYRGGFGRVLGTVCRAREGAPRGWLEALDRFEGAAGAGGEYSRRPVLAELGDGIRLRAEAYLYNLPPDRSLTPIHHGDFVRYLAETGLRPFGG